MNVRLNFVGNDTLICLDTGCGVPLVDFRSEIRGVGTSRHLTYGHIAAPFHAPGLLFVALEPDLEGSGANPERSLLSSDALFGILGISNQQSLRDHLQSFLRCWLLSLPIIAACSDLLNLYRLNKNVEIRAWIMIHPFQESLEAASRCEVEIRLPTQPLPTSKRFGNQ